MKHIFLPFNIIHQCCTVLKEEAKRKQHVSCNTWTQGSGTKIYPESTESKPVLYWFAKIMVQDQTIFTLDRIQTAIYRGS